MATRQWLKGWALRHGLVGPDPADNTKDYEATVNSDGSMNVKAVASIPAGANIIGKVGIDQTTPGTTNLVDTELPAAAVLGDAAANPTAPAVAAHLKVWNGTSWDNVDGVDTGALQTVLKGYNSAAAAYYGFRQLDGAGASSISNTYLGYALNTNAVLIAHNGATNDTWRNNTEVTVLASAARTASENSADITVYNGAMLAVFLDVTAVSGTSPTLDVTVKVKDVASGKYFVIGTFTQATAVTKQAIFIGGGADVEFATRTYRVECVIAGTTPSFTFSVGASATVA